MKTTTILKEPSARVNSVAISQWGRSVVSGSDDGSVRLWNPDRNQVLAIFEGHNAAVVSVDLDPYLSHAVSGSLDGTVRIWDLNLSSEE